jgi:hypothetical protein
MDMKRVITLVVIGVSMAGAAVAFAPAASAHEAKTVNGYHWLVGFGDEPTYAGFKNFVQLFLSTPSGETVLNIGNELKVTVETGSSKQSFPLVPSFDPDSGLGIKGEFDAFFIPTTPGTYTFHFTGNLGGPVDVSFTGGPTTFSTVADPSTIQFPVQVPSTLELTQKIDREIPRLTAAIIAAQGSAESHADSKANTALTVGVLGVVFGLVGLGFALSAKRKKA